MKIKTILLTLMGNASCDAKWAKELLGAVISTADDWELLGVLGSPNIVV